MTFTLACALVLCRARNAPANPLLSAPQSTVSRFELANGLKVRLRPVQGADRVAVLVLFGIGGNQDPPGKSGLAHLVEHMYVTSAAAATPARTAEQWMTSRNGNAQTGEDYTLVAETVPSSGLDAAIQDAAARMGELRLEESLLDREKQRLLDEVNNMFGAMPSLGAFNLARERVRPAPNGGRRGGAPDQVQRLTIADVQDWWQNFYKPANATLVIAGSFSPQAAESAVRTAFSSLPAGRKAPPPAAPGTPHGGTPPEVIRQHAVAGSAEGELVFRAPLPDSPDFAAWLVLVTRMGQSAGTLAPAGEPRFPPPVSYSPLDDPWVFGLGSPLRKGESPAAATARLRRFVGQACAGRLAPQDVEVARMLFGPLLGLGSVPDLPWAQNPYGLALSIGRREQLALDPAALNRRLSALRDFDLRRCVARWLSPTQGAAVIVVPR